MTPPDSSNDPSQNSLLTSTVAVGNTTISMQQLQQIHSELTGKSLNITEFYDTPIQITLDDIANLHHRLVQAWEQYHVVSSNAAFTIFYYKDSKAEYPSFDHFHMSAQAGSQPVESVVIKYDLLIVLPSLQKAQSYSITVRLVSQVAVQMRLHDEDSFSPLPRFIRSMANLTGWTEITYVDSSVARALNTVLKDWFNIAPQARRNWFMKPAQRYSHWIPRLARLCAVAITVLLVAGTLPRLLVVGDPKNELLEFGKIALWSSFGVYFAHLTAGWLGHLAEHSVDIWGYTSFIKLNGADQREIDKFIARKQYNFWVGLVGFICSFCTSLLGKIVLTLVLKFM